MAKQYILNFTVSRELDDIKYSFDEYGKTNLSWILEDFKTGETTWSVPKTAVPGDIAVFLCAKTSRNKLGMATSSIPDDYGKDFRDFVEVEKALYKKYSGNILGYGVISARPEYDDVDNRWSADINQLRQIPNPILYDDIKSFIDISSWSSITYISEDQWEHLKWLVNQKNNGFFDNVVAPSAETLEQEFKSQERKASTKSLDKLKKEAEKKGNIPVESIVQTKTFQRNPIIAAYVKKRADGKCQLCGAKAPFIDQNGDPYLECHHIEWLSKGGMDSVDNCVALCPNCHRRMHVLNDPNDIESLKKTLQKLQ